jgi:Xaa-Pro aminopeptidase
LSIYSRRRERVLSLAGGYDTIVVSDPKNLFYLTDFWGGGTGFVGRESTLIVTSVMEEDRATADSKESVLKTAKGKSAMLDLAKKQLKGKVLTDTYDPSIRGKVDAELFQNARRQKDAQEIRRITEASDRVEKLYKLLEKKIAPGRTERELAADVMRLATAEGLSPLAAEGSLSPIIIATGPNSALPHAELSDRKVKAGDMLVADIFFRYKGYCTDCTRTYAVGKVSKDAQDGYQAVLEAQLEGIGAAKKGVAASEVHEKVAAVLRRHGVEKYFTHGTGHGVGIDIHEQPSIGASSKDILASGDVITIEPGIYIPGKFGVRIEDTVALGREDKVLYGYTKDLVVV